MTTSKFFFILVLIVSLPSQVVLSRAVDSNKIPRYVIVTDANSMNSRDSYAEVVKELSKLRKPAAVLNLNENGFGDLFDKLRALEPDYVAFVVPPEKIEANFVGAVFEGLTALDEDPYLDCPFGYITGATPADALKLVLNTAAAQARPDKVEKKFVAIGHTFAENDLGPFATQQANRYKTYGYETAEINPIDNSTQWQRNADREIQKLNGASLVFLAGHGMGNMSCTIAGGKFGSVELQSAVVVNGTCHSAVTNIRYDSKDRFWTMQTTRIKPEESVCLNFIKAGAIGQFASTASSGWQNVAFAITKFFRQGQSLGRALQESLNDKIRKAGIKKIHIIPFRDGQKSPQALGKDENPGGIQSISRVILIGDPAYRPFPRKLARISPRNRINDYSGLPPEQRQIRKLIDELSDPQAPRFEALNKLIRIGGDAVPELINEMKTSNDWQIPKALGAIGDNRATGPLIEKLEKSDRLPLRNVLAEALQRLTKEDFGTDAKAWGAWFKKQKQTKG